MQNAEFEYDNYSLLNNEKICVQQYSEAGPGFGLRGVSFFRGGGRGVILHPYSVHF